MIALKYRGKVLRGTIIHEDHTLNEALRLMDKPLLKESIAGLTGYMSLYVLVRRLDQAYHTKFPCLRSPDRCLQKALRAALNHPNATWTVL